MLFYITEVEYKHSGRQSSILCPMRKYDWDRISDPEILQDLPLYVFFRLLCKWSAEIMIFNYIFIDLLYFLVTDFNWNCFLRFSVVEYVLILSVAAEVETKKQATFQLLQIWTRTIQKNKLKLRGCYLYFNIYILLTLHYLRLYQSVIVPLIHFPRLVIYNLP